MPFLKVCRACKVEKPVDEFGVVKSNDDGRRYACKECYNGIRKRYRQNHGDEISSYKRSLYYLHHEKSKKRLRARYPLVRAWTLMSKYGMTTEQYADMLASQNGLCAICKRPPSVATGHAIKKSLHVDHDHKTGLVRGLLCNSCNIGIGMFNDDGERMADAISYLQSKTLEQQKCHNLN